MNISAYVWLVLLILFVMMEASSVTLVSLWFAAGALVATVAALLGASLTVQTVLFVLVSVVLLALLRPILKKYVDPKIQKTNVDALVGRECTVTEDIDNLAACGRVKVGGMSWSARSAAGEHIPAGTVVKIEAVQGVKLLVTPVAVPEAVK
ncbi:MAG: NfeD family protein [Candidatus Faecousia sp.]|nr:NfeD family protein [Candidatus Faecousia sp.]